MVRRSFSEGGQADTTVLGPEMEMIRVILPQHLQTLARVGSEVAVDVSGPATLGAVLDALEERYPVLRGTIRDHSTRKRRAFVR